MRLSVGPNQSQRQSRAPRSRHPAFDSSSAAGCPAEREDLWHRRTLFWRTLSGVQVKRSLAIFDRSLFPVLMAACRIKDDELRQTGILVAEF
ncbi:hypothetical protein XENOCAPTIV_003795 [Xenoophorus captivus]|uniref:Uncharacterized protein n=1 Tax=Xenoophorus captivus TaxID=1517983 RepID=A0ABV0RWP0_9TELE